MSNFTLCVFISNQLPQAPAALTNSTLPDIVALRETWDVLTSRLSRVDPQSGDQIEGVFEMQGALGSHVTSIVDLATARPKPQHSLGTLCMRALERGWRRDASVQDCVRLTECGGTSKEAGWVNRCPTRPEYCMPNHLWRTSVLVAIGDSRLIASADGPVTKSSVPLYFNVLCILY